MEVGPNNQLESAINVQGWAPVVARAIIGPKEKAVEKMPRDQTELLNNVFFEQEEREKRKSNILIFGLKKHKERTGNAENDNKNELSEVENLLKVIGCGEGVVATARRFRETEANKIPPIFVRLKPGVDRFKIVAAARSLRNKPEFKGVYVNLDRTQAEREYDRGLRESQKMFNRLEEETVEEGRRRYWVIRNGRVKRGADEVNITSL